MIALLLASQIVGVVSSNPNLQNFAASAAPRSSELIRQLPRKAACKNDPGRLEVSFGQPVALYRQGDRPPKGLKKWADYPDAALCAVEDAK